MIFVRTTKMLILTFLTLIVYAKGEPSLGTKFVRGIVSGTPATLHQVLKNSGNLTTILKDDPIKMGEFPWHVIIKQDEFDDLLCGGSILSSQWVATAAHCCDGKSSLLLRFGTIDLENDDDLSTTASEFHIHPQYSPKTHNNDVCLIKLPSELRFSDTIKPIPLLPMSQASNTFVGSIAVIAGFGIMDDEYLDKSEKLLWAQIKIIENRECADVFGDGAVIESTLCGKGYGVANMSICTGDSGGALVTRDQNGNWMQIGLNSFVPLDRCTEALPSAYARISSFLSYIYNITGLPPV